MNLEEKKATLVGRIQLTLRKRTGLAVLVWCNRSWNPATEGCSPCIGMKLVSSCVSLTNIRGGIQVLRVLPRLCAQASQCGAQGSGCCLYSSNELRHELVYLNVPCRQGKREEAPNAKTRAGQTMPLHLDISRNHSQKGLNWESGHSYISLTLVFPQLLQ